MTTPNDLFITATKNNYLFPNPNGGTLNVIDLWQLPLTSNTKLSLDAIAVAIYSDIEKQPTISFVNQSNSKQLDEKRNKLEIIKFVIETKQQENAAKLQEAQRKQRKQHLLQLLDEKENEQLRSKSIDEIRALINAED